MEIEDVPLSPGQTGLTPKTWQVLTMAVEDGVECGWNYAHKYVENPQPQRIRDEIVEGVMNSLSEWFDIK